MMDDETRRDIIRLKVEQQFGSIVERRRFANQKWRAMSFTEKLRIAQERYEASNRSPPDHAVAHHDLN